MTTHLSPYAIVTEMVGKTCATVQTAFGCAATGAPTAGGGPSSGGTAPPNTGAGATGGSSSTCDPPTCAGATNVCAQYPGAAMDSCVDSSTGYSAACCFPSNAPICFAIAGAGGRLRGRDGDERRWVDLSAPSDLRLGDGCHGVRGLSGRDAPELHERRDGIHGRLLLRARRRRCA